MKTMLPGARLRMRADGPYALLNTNTYLSSDPGSAAGGVSITFTNANSAAWAGEVPQTGPHFIGAEERPRLRRG